MSHGPDPIGEIQEAVARARLYFAELAARAVVERAGTTIEAKAEDPPPQRMNRHERRKARARGKR